MIENAHTRAFGRLTVLLGFRIRHEGPAHFVAAELFEDDELRARGCGDVAGGLVLFGRGCGAVGGDLVRF